MTRFAPQWLQNGSYAAAQDRQLIGAIWPQPMTSGLALGAPGAGMTITVGPGQAAVPTANNTGATLCTSDATETVTLAAAPASGYSRIDVVTVHPRGNDLDGGSNDDWILDVITGAVAQSPTNPTAPAVPAGQVAIANVTVPGGAATIVAGNIADVRPGTARPWNTAWGAVAPPAVITAAGPVQGGNANVPGLSVTINAVAGRRYRITAFCRNIGTVGSGTTDWNVMRGATVLSTLLVSTAAGTFTGGANVAYDTPPAGPQTYTVRTSTTATSAQIIANNTGAPASILLEDIGPA